MIMVMHNRPSLQTPFIPRGKRQKIFVHVVEAFSRIEVRDFLVGSGSHNVSSITIYNCE